MPTPAAPRFAFPTLFAIVFIDLVGFGIVIPLVPFYAQRLGARPELITLIIALHSLCQTMAMPLWGALSDRSGRRPVLLVSMGGHALSYLLMGYADSLWILALARVLSGVTSANIATAYAYITDITAPEERAQAMGRISAAFGLGFAVGPAIGGLLAGGDSMASADLMRPAIGAAIASGLSFLSIWLFLPETHQGHGGGAGRPEGSTFGNLGRVARRPVITMMLGLALLATTFLAAREAIFPLWLHERLGFTARQLGIVLGFSGGLISLIQFGAMGWLTRRFGELRLVKAAIVLFAVGWVGLTLVQSMGPLLVVLTVTCFGSAFFQTCMQSLLSQRAGPAERGLVLGAYQSSSALARFVGQASAGTMYGQIGINAPYLIGAAVMVPAYWLARRIGQRIEAVSPPAPVPASPRRRA
jgi:DHA1 family tetracycline resistance protein-like MFS transporter